MDHFWMNQLWAFYAFAAALAMTSIPLLQEKFKADGIALTFWIKVFVTLSALVPVLHYGLAVPPMFYVYTLVTTVIYIISDIVYFRSVPHIGAGMMTRLLPSSVLITFVLWMVIEPQRVDAYISKPWIGAGTCALIIAFVFCAMRVKRCPVSWQGVKRIWPVLASASLGPIITKMALNEAAANAAHENVATFAYMFVQSGMTVALIGLYHLVRRPIPTAVMFERNAIRTGFIIGIAIAAMLFFKTKALQLTDNPAYVVMVFFTDALWVMLIYRLIGRKEQGDIRAGIGIVICAALLVLLKSFV